MKSNDTITAGSTATTADASVRFAQIVNDGIDRRAIRKGRKEASKAAKRFVRQRYNEVLTARPSNSRPAEQIVRLVVEFYRNGPIFRRNLKAVVIDLEAAIRRQLPDLIVLRAPRSVSQKPERVGLMVYETRAITEESDQIITAENHSVVLEEGRVVFISGLLPGGTRPHLFERVFERDGRRLTMAEVQVQLTAVWPTLLWMRTEQRRHGRGSPISVMITPFADGLLFGSITKIENLPMAAGPTVVIVDRCGSETRQLYDYYGDTLGNRLWAMTNTYVDAALLSFEQLQLRDMLAVFVRKYGDVIADHDWRWRIGLGDTDPAVEIVAQTFRITIASTARRAAALSELEAIVASDPWQRVAASSLLSQQRRGQRQEA